MAVKSKYAKPRGRKPGVEDPFEIIRVPVPRKTAIELRELAYHWGTSLERLIGRLAINSAKSKVGFELKGCILMDPVCTPEHIEKIYSLIAKADDGIDMEALLMLGSDLNMTACDIEGAVNHLVRTKTAESVKEIGKYPVIRLFEKKKIDRTRKYTFFAGRRNKSPRKQRTVKKDKGVL